MSAAAEKNQASGSSQPTMDIPIVNVPDYPDRTPRRGPLKLNMGPMTQQQKQGLTAPTMADVSSSGPKNAANFLLTHKTLKTFSLLEFRFLPSSFC